MSTFQYYTEFELLYDNDKSSGEMNGVIEFNMGLESGDFETAEEVLFNNFKEEDPELKSVSVSLISRIH